MKRTVAIVTMVLAGLCCCSLIITGIFFLLGKNLLSEDKEKLTNPLITTVPTLILENTGDEQNHTPDDLLKNIHPGALETLETIKNQPVPENNVRLLTERLKGIKDIPEVVSDEPINYQIGDKKKFWVSEDETHQKYQVDAILRYKGNHIYFWVDVEANYSKSKLKDLAETFDQKIYAKNRDFFGSEWSPGVDNDPRLYILYAHGVGSRIAGFFSSTDEVNPLVNPYSNVHEMFILNSDTVALSDPFTYGVMAHEFQHMIHWYRDRNEDAWLNEGFSELASFINGYNNGGFDYSFISDPDLQLNDWPNDKNKTTPHYGASFLFTNYFYDRFGEKNTQKIIAEKENGLDSFDKVLAEINTGNENRITADDVFADWVVTNYLLDETIGDGRYYYRNYPDSPQAKATEKIEKCPQKLEGRTVSQYGADYLEINCQGDFMLNFVGSMETKLVPSDPHSGDYAFWSNKGDESDMTLTHRFDFRNSTGNISLDYWVWYDVEDDFDYVYLEVSEDGENWKIINTPSGTDKNPSGNNYGWGYNGKTNSWIKESINLDDYKGKVVSIRFEYITDSAVNGEGFLIDDISIQAIDYKTDFENGIDGWEAQGFVRVQNQLPQKYILSLITSDEQGIKVNKIMPDSKNQANISLHLKRPNDKATVVISGITRYTRETAPYYLEIN